MRDFVQKFFMILGAMFFVGIFFPQFRIQLAEAVAPILDPLLVLPIHIVILILAIFTAIYSTLIQKYTVDYERMKEIQRRVMEYQKKYMKAMKENNQFVLKQLEQQKNEISSLQAELMSMNFRSMFYTVVVTIPIWVWLWYRIYNVAQTGYHGFYSGVSKFMVRVPFQGLIHVSDRVLVIPWWFFWFILCSILVGQILRRLLRLGW